MISSIDAESDIINGEMKMVWRMLRIPATTAGGTGMKGEALKILEERFGHDSLISLATVKDGLPAVRTVDGYYEDCSFYVVTYAESNKIKEIIKNPAVAVCGEWFTASGTGEILGWVGEQANEEMMQKLRSVFSEWYNNGHVDEADHNTCLLRIRLTKGVLFNRGTRYDIDF